MRYKLTRQAERDYREILAFTLNEWGVEQFNTYATLIDMEARSRRRIHQNQNATLRAQNQLRFTG
jgi:plasmid stabilization system protein ParE